MAVTIAEVLRVIHDCIEFFILSTTISSYYRIILLVLYSNWRLAANTEIILK